MKRLLLFVISAFLLQVQGYSQVPANINSGNPNFPFPQFKEYNKGTLKTIASFDHHSAGVTHAEFELRIREAYQMICNNMSYNIDQNGTFSPLTVNNVKYIMPNVNPNTINHCTCVEGDAYYLLAAAYMADKPTFDGYFMWMHDRQFQKTARFVDNVTNSPNYPYNPGISGAGSMSSGTNVYGGALGGNSATDGDVDLGMALLIAWKQWGDNGVICNDPELGPITYKAEALKYISTMADTLLHSLSLPVKKYVSGIIGLDGYLKNGDSWNELSNWAMGGYKGMNPLATGGSKVYIDYSAPSYFKTFADVLTSEGKSPWAINQYKRAEASCDWAMGQMASRGLVGFAGGWQLDNTNTPTFSSYNDGEDFRLGWRTVLNYVWHGNPTTSWNPSNDPADPTGHQVIPGGNTFELDFAKNNEKFLLSPESYNNKPYRLPTLKLEICGPSTMTTYHSPTGFAFVDPKDPNGNPYFRLNKAFGAFSPSTVATQNFRLMSEVYRKCEITWDGAESTQKYLDSNPLYFHEFFRFLGMMVLTGNWHDPLDMVPEANMKIYKSVNKTYAYIGDTLTYKITYRNFGKPSATGVVIKDPLPTGLTFLSQSPRAAGVSFSQAGGNLTWTVGTVPGTEIGVPAKLSQTMDTITLKVLVNSNAPIRICNSATITATNGSGWTSNEYPNNVTETMERNCVDILEEKPLSIVKSVNRSIIQVGDSIVYTIKVKNKSVAFLNGGRPGVYFTMGLQPFTNPATELKVNFRFFHGAQEAYINLKNYRVSYFLKENGPPNWQVAVSNAEGFGTLPPAIGVQPLVPGAGYNHRFFITFANALTTVTQHLAEYSGGPKMIHRGELSPPRMEARVFTNPTGSFNFTDDWSADLPALSTTGASDDLQTLITNDWSDPYNPNIPINKYHPEACGTTTKISNKVLVEEWDGYTWRRILGNSPAAGRELNNVIVKDTLPNSVTFGGYITGYPVGSLAGNVITWPTVPQLLVNDSIEYKFWVRVKNAAYFNCPAGPTPAEIINTGYAKADNEPWVKDTAKTKVSCDAVFIPDPSISKKADKANYSTGDDVTYTVIYKNKSGTLVPSIGTAADWTQVEGNPFGFSGGNMSIGGVSSSNTMVHKYSHGLNGSITTTAYFADDQEVYALVFRQNGVNWYEIRFKKVYNGFQISLWEHSGAGYTQLMAPTLNTAFSNPPFNEVDIKLDLFEDKASFSIVKTGQAMPGAPQYIQTGLKKVAGYAGWRAQNTSVSTVKKWNTWLDSGFEIVMRDPIPAGVTFVSATDANLSGCPSCTPTTITGSNTAGNVTYTKITGPVLANDSVKYVWKGNIASCPATGLLINTAYVDIKGITPSPSAQVVTGCDVTITPLNFLSFEVSQAEKTVFLNWTTDNEQNVSHFNILISQDGKSWSTLPVNIPAKNQSLNEYQYTIDASNSGVTYYKIQEIDKDGKTDFSKVKSLNFGNDDEIYVYPNPADEKAHIRYSLSGEKILTVIIFDVQGKKIFENTYSSLAEKGEITIDLDMASGIYILEVIADTFVKDIKLIKK